jgi:DNA-binding SARP family transcriptional activator
MWFAVLGAIEVRRGGSVVSVGGPRQRALLAMLLCNAGHPVSQDRLIEELLPGVPHESAERMLRVQISRLRAVLAEDGEPQRILTTPRGYQFTVGDDEFDAAAFERTCAEARAATADSLWAQAVQLWRAAEALWLGDPFGEFTGEPFAQPCVQRLRELHESAVEQRLEAQLALGEHLALLPELEALVAQYPLREPPRRQLMLALHRAGRPAEALEAYRSFRALLVEELGIEPSRALTDVQRTVLAQDSFLDPQAGQGQAATVRVSTPVAAARDAEGAPQVGVDGPLSEPPMSRYESPAVRPGRASWLRRRRWPAALVGVVSLGSLGFSSLSLPQTQRAGSAGPSLALLDAQGSEQTNLSLDATPGPAVSGFGGIWVVEPSKGLLVRVDASSRRVVTTIPVGSSPAQLSVGSHDLWVGDSADHTLTRVDPRTDSVTQTINVGVVPAAVVESGGTLFVAGPGTDIILRIDPTTGLAKGSLQLPDPVTALAAAETGIWALSEASGTLTRIDPASGSVTAHLHIATGPRASR